MHNPEALNQAWIALTVLGISIILETFSLLGALKEIRLLRGDQSFCNGLNIPVMLN